MGQLPDFEFQPYEASELSSDEPLCAPATSRFEVSGWVRRTVYLARIAEHRWGYPCVWLKRHEPNAPVLVVADVLNQETKTLVRCVRERKWRRTVAFDSHFKLAAQRSDVFVDLRIQQHLFFYSTSWKIKEKQSHEFIFVDRFEDVFNRGRGGQLGAKYLEHRVNEDLKNPDSGCAFALRWMKMDTREKMNWLCRTRQGTLDEMEEILGWVALNDERIWKEWEPLIWNLKFHRSQSFCLSMQSSFPLHIVGDNMIIGGLRVPLNPNQERLLRIIGDYFRCSRVKVGRDHPPLRLTSTFIAIPEIFISSPSAHERLEARLRLREWLADKVAPEEIPALLGDA